ncbi:MAG: tRNA (N6-threonylcarbamoyladenosine(37)-N6)-methyltransferase TrmO [Lachnospiraceae bacterium]|nr:tRNA (N6-threonylcarbamoyladenosine(37)-N6)-methyltransferase TrmO [Lachnospiraceae bacterium]
MDRTLKIIGTVHTDFPEKFGIPRQSGLIPDLKGYISFEKEYRNPDFIRGIEDFEYIWVLWEFDVPRKERVSATVLPPRLGGKTHMGVFATRSPFRPNPIGLSSVKLEGVEETEKGPILLISGVDIRDNTKVYDIKPYLNYADAHPDAKSGFGEENLDYKLNVEFPEELLSLYPPDKRALAIEILKQDPRPAYQEDPDRRYGVSFAGFDIHFKVSDGILRVIRVVPLN